MRWQNQPGEKKLGGGGTIRILIKCTCNLCFELKDV